MKTIQEQLAVMQHFADGGKVEMQYADGTWKLNDAPQWEWWSINYRIAEEADPYAELKVAAKNPTKQIRYRAKGVWMEWIDANSPGGFFLVLSAGGIFRVPAEDKEIEVQDE